MNPVISENDQYYENELFLRALNSSIDNKTLTPVRKSFEQQLDIENNIDIFLNNLFDSVKIELKHSTY